MARSARAENVRLNQLRAQQQQAERHRRLTIVIAAIAAIVLVVAVLVGFAVFGPKQQQQQSASSGSLDPAVLTTLTTIPAGTFDTVGVGVGASNPPKGITSSPLTQDGKPEVLYVGAEYCPFCAAQRWPLVVALSRFGQFSGLQATTSGAAPEAYPNTATLSFHGATYSSQYLSFTGIETQTNTNQPLDTLSGEAKTLFQTYNPQGSIPWTNYGGQSAQTGASVDPGLLAGKSQQEIATAIADPNTDISKAVLGSANVITARLCSLTNNAPADVCSSSGVKAAAAAQP